MAECGLCGNEMLNGDSCDDHQILLTNGDVIDCPTHSEEGSLGVDGQCPDCGVNPGGTHHANCDWARRPNGKQILISAAEWPTDKTPEYSQTDLFDGS